MATIFLKEQYLKQLSYSSVWGLYKTKDSNNSLWQEVVWLKEKDIYQNKLIQQQSGMEKSGFVFRNLCWIFNINNYRKNTYSLAALYSDFHFNNFNASKQEIKNKYFVDNLQSKDLFIAMRRLGCQFSSKYGRYKEKWFIKTFNMLKGLLNFHVTDQSSNHVNYGHINNNSLERENITESSSNTLSTLFDTETLVKTEPNINYKDSFILTSDITQYALGVLGRNASMGETITSSEIKKLRRSALLKNHPDKTKQDQNFPAVAEAYTMLLEEEYNPYEKSNDKINRQSLVRMKTILPHKIQILKEMLKEDSKEFAKNLEQSYSNLDYFVRETVDELLKGKSPKSQGSEPNKGKAPAIERFSFKEDQRLSLINSRHKDDVHQNIYDKPYGLNLTSDLTP
ncbi:MAG: hypothetical protein P1U74_08320 [Legionellaceae bacterium]|nr:hypothetical protein [Legionellaceae bacterium]